MQEPLLRMVNISKSFGEVHSLQNVDFEIGKNETVGLLGDNGAGKSTLVKIITGYHQPDPGAQLYFNGNKIDHLDVVRARQLGIQAVSRSALWRISSRYGETSLWAANGRLHLACWTSRPCKTRHDS